MSPARRATPCSRGSACRCSSPRSACRTLLPLECAFTLGARMFKEDLLKGKRILITGGGTGLGKEIAARYLELGAELWLAGRRGPVLDSTAKELTSKYGGGGGPESDDTPPRPAGRPRGEGPRGGEGA